MLILLHFSEIFKFRHRLQEQVSSAINPHKRIRLDYWITVCRPVFKKEQNDFLDVSGISIFAWLFPSCSIFNFLIEKHWLCKFA